MNAAVLDGRRLIDSHQLEHVGGWIGNPGHTRAAAQSRAHTCRRAPRRAGCRLAASVSRAGR